MPDASYSLAQCPSHPSLWNVVEHYQGHSEPLCGWTTEAQAQALKDRMDAAVARRARERAAWEAK